MGWGNPPSLLQVVHMNFTNVINMGLGYANSTINGIKGSSEMVSTNTGIPQWMILMGIVVVAILLAKDNAKNAIVFAIIALLIFVIIGGLGVIA